MRPHRASLTATKIGRIVLSLARHPRYASVLPEGLGEETERVMLAAGLARPWMLRLFETGAWRSFVRVVEDRTVPGQTLAFGLRKRFMDAEVRDAVAAGVRQVAVVGAGFDTLAPRLAAALPEVLFVEVDHPATQEAKRRALGRAAPNLRLVPADLSQRPLDAVLAEVPAWDPGAAAVFVAEGLLMYLDDAAVGGLFSAAARASGPGSRFAFTWLRRLPDGSVDFGRVSGLLDRGLAAVGEPLRWAAYPEALPGFLREHGWALIEDPARTDLRARFLVPAGLGEDPLGEVERMGVATR